jgi:hypothetical protein
MTTAAAAAEMSIARTSMIRPMTGNVSR